MPKVGSATLGALPSTVLSDPAPLIGRERELEAIRTHLLGESVRLVTSTGPGGIGKTRLALAATRYVQPAFRDGVWFVDLAPLHDPAGVDAAIGEALRVEEATALSPAERVAAYLRDRHLSCWSWITLSISCPRRPGWRSCWPQRRRSRCWPRAANR